MANISSCVPSRCSSLSTSYLGFATLSGVAVAVACLPCRQWSVPVPVPVSVSVVGVVIAVVAVIVIGLSAVCVPVARSYRCALNFAVAVPLLLVLVLVQSPAALLPRFNLLASTIAALPAFRFVFPRWLMLYLKIYQQFVGV